MPSGTVKWFNATKGTGLFSQTAVEVMTYSSISLRWNGRGFSSLAEGAKVSFDIVQNRGKESAENLRIG